MLQPFMARGGLGRNLAIDLLKVRLKVFVIVFRTNVVGWTRARLGKNREDDSDKVSSWLDESSHLLPPVATLGRRDGDEESAESQSAAFLDVLAMWAVGDEDTCVWSYTRLKRSSGKMILLYSKKLAATKSELSKTFWGSL
jgi:hypothetical protein